MHSRLRAHVHWKILNLIPISFGNMGGERDLGITHCAHIASSSDYHHSYQYLEAQQHPLIAYIIDNITATL